MSGTEERKHESFHQKLRNANTGLTEEQIQWFADDQTITPKEVARAQEIAREEGEQKEGPPRDG
jgi:hypothetical protein